LPSINKKRKNNNESRAKIYPKIITTPSSSRRPNPIKKIGTAQSMFEKGIGKGSERIKAKNTTTSP